VSSKLDKGENIYGYGAAAKASTIINASGILPHSITAIGDASPEKIGRYMPSLNTPIISPEALIAAKPDNLLIFPWNISEEILHWISESGLEKTQIWRTMPELSLVEFN
jgi:ABC-type Fe3+-hydroxamate transport system substrate-binding protein